MRAQCIGCGKLTDMGVPITICPSCDRVMQNVIKIAGFEDGFMFLLTKMYKEYTRGRE